MTARTIAVTPGSNLGYLVWPAKGGLDVLPSDIDLSSRLANLGVTVAAAPIVSADPALTVTYTGRQAAVLSFLVGGGVSNTHPLVIVQVPLSDAGSMVLSITQPIDVAAAPALPPAQPVGSSQAVGMLAAAVIRGHRVLMPDGLGGVLEADPASDRYQFVGIATGAAAAHATVAVAEAGSIITEPTWSWAAGAALFVAPDGSLTSAAPTTGLLQQVAVANGPTTILVQPFPPISLH